MPVSLWGRNQTLEVLPVQRDSSLHRIPFRLQNSYPQFDGVCENSLLVVIHTLSIFRVKILFFCDTMATKALANEAIAMTEKKINMTLDEIIQMSKKNAAKGKRLPRPPIKNQGFQKKNPSQANAMLQGYMDSRSSIRQGVLAKRRSNFHGNQFPAITELARKAAAISFENRVINQNGRRVVTPTRQRSANAGSTSKRPQTLDALFANMNEMRMNFGSQNINPRGSVELVRRPFGSRQQQRRGGPRGGRIQLAQRPFGSKQQQGRGGRGPRGGVQLGQRRFGSGQQLGRGGPRGSAHGGPHAAARFQITGFAK